jgi:GMP synthase (glutamine-hydrolysing)
MSRPGTKPDLHRPEGSGSSVQAVSRVLIVEHAPAFGPGGFAPALQERALGMDVVRLYRGDPLPKDLSGVDGVIVLGGPEAGSDSTWSRGLNEEMVFLGRALDRKIPLLTLSLGSQLLAATLGARVTAAKYLELGWHDTRLKPAAFGDALLSGEKERFTAFYWPVDIFDLPRGAASLASSDLVEHQAFRWGTSAYGLRFHPEINAEQILARIQSILEDPSLKREADPVAAGLGAHLPPLRDLGKRILGRWVELVLARKLAGWLS